MEDVILEFLAESSEGLDQVDQDLIELRHKPDCEHSLARVFRTIHTIKGTAGFLGYERVGQVGHAGESLLDLIRDGELTLSPEILTGLLAMTDTLRALIQAIESDRCEGERDVSAVVRQLEVLAEVSQRPQPAEAAEADSSEACSRSEKPELRDLFVEEALEAIDAFEEHVMLLIQEELAADNPEDQRPLLRTLHGLKGACSFMELGDLERLCHTAEGAIASCVDSGQALSEPLLAALVKTADELRIGAVDFREGGRGSVSNLEAHCSRLIEAAKAETADADPAGEAPRPRQARVLSLGDLGEVVRETQARRRSSLSLPPQQSSAQPAAPIPQPKQVTVSQRRKAVEARAKASTLRQSIRVDIAKLDRLVNLVGELVVAEAMVTRNPEIQALHFESFERATHQLRRISSELQDVALSVRMIPVASTFRKMVRLVHDVSGKSGKKVALVLEGEETEMDKTVIEKIADPLVHLMRNAIDHGVEDPETRRARGKPEIGKIVLSAQHERGEVWIKIRDDGGGISRDAVLRKAVERGLVGPEADLSDDEVYQLIFEPGFSTAGAVTEISGRGVGMDVVKRNLEALGGRIEIQTELGQGTCFSLRIPLTLAIIDAMLLRVGRDRYAIPLLSIREAIRLDSNSLVGMADGSLNVRVRDELFPVVSLHQVLDQEPLEFGQDVLVLVSAGGSCVALKADEILGQQECVVKQISGYVNAPRCVSACTILGDGQVGLILDVADLVSLAAERPSPDLARAG